MAVRKYLSLAQTCSRLARTLGYNPHCWEELTELVLPLLEDPAYYTQTLYGSVPGSRAVHYVKAIQKRYARYSRYVTRELSSASLPTLRTPQAASASG
jgi:membrane-bound lytic murein transglycosylase MltF